MDQIFTLRNAIEQCTEWQWILRRLSTASTEKVWCIIRAYGIPHQIVIVIKSLYSNFKYRVGNSESRLGVKTGVRQGCPMLALLFNLTIC